MSKAYNVWRVDQNRWTNASLNASRTRILHGHQNPQNPLRLSKEDADLLLEKIKSYIEMTPQHSIAIWEIRMLPRHRARKSSKVIPDIPLDPTLPVLQAGYLQDRERKHFKK
jgi:hypothetical protein